MSKKTLAAVLLIMTGQHILAGANDYSVYIVQPGDTVSEVLSKNNKAPLYGRGKWEEQTLKLNRLNRNSTKKLVPGDVIVLPVAQKRYYSQAPSAQDKINLKNASTMTSAQFELLQRSNHKFTIWGEYFNRNSNFSTSNSDVELRQNFAVSVDYLYRDYNSTRSFTVNPIASFGVYTQSNASFSNDPFLTAELTPSYRVRGGAEIESRQFQASITPFTEFEYFSYIDNDTSGNFSVRKDQIIWAGAQVRKTFEIKSFSPYIGAEFSTSVAGSNEKAVSVSQSLDGNKSRVFLGTSFNDKYNIEIYREQLDLEDQTAFEVDSTGVKFGYRF
jgi:hypothetical protein